MLRLEGGDLILGPTMPTILAQLGAFDADRGIVFTNAILKSKCQQDANHGENITRHPRPVVEMTHGSWRPLALVRAKRNEGASYPSESSSECSLLALSGHSEERALSLLLTQSGLSTDCYCRWGLVERRRAPGFVPPPIAN